MRLLRFGSEGTDVYEIQATLNKIGYNTGPIDGIYGLKTYEAVRNFQNNFGLVPDGVFGPVTYNALEPFIVGFKYYKIQRGDTLNKIAKKFYTSVNSIITSNPGINPYNLIVNSIIVVPYGYDVVDTNINYTYDVLRRDVMGLKMRYPFLEVGSIGNSVLGRDLTYIKIGNGPNKVFYNGAHHSLEWITSPLLMKFVENFSKAYSTNTNISGYSPREIWEKSTIYIVPMVNPDGIDLVLNGLSKDNPFYEQLVIWNNGSTNFSNVWQANNRGVDLNHNYNASWELGKEVIEEEFGISDPGPTRYSGPYPESEPESRAVANFTRNNDFRLVLAYHSQGEVIYWDYNNMATEEAKRIGEEFSRVSGYDLDETYGVASYSGYKDWFIKEYQKPGYTIEVGKGINPLPISQFDRIYEDNIELLLLASII